MSKPALQTDVEYRKAALTSLRDQAKSADVLNDDHFCGLINACQVVLEMSDREIGSKLMVSRPTVNRWSNGRNLPHRAMRKPIFDSIAQMASQRLRLASKTLVMDFSNESSVV